MKAPDKICVLMDKSTGFLSHTFTNVPCEYEGTKQDIEYIRKDALLEWAKEQWLHTRNGTIADQIRSSAYEEMIKHIKSL